MKLCSLGSGSRGNSFYIEGNETKLLIDAGFYISTIEERLSEINSSLGEIDGILITHEHRDHIIGLNLVCQNYNIPVYANGETADEMLQWVRNPDIRIFENGSNFSIGEFEIRAFPTIHDSVNSSGFVIKLDNKKIFYATDLGFVTSLVKERMKDSDLIVFESNHDRQMLLNGSYPHYLKQRILSREGHISNEESATALKETIDKKVKRIILAHVSLENNHTDVLMDTHQKILDGKDVPLSIAYQDEVSEIFEI